MSSEKIIIRSQEELISILQKSEISANEKETVLHFFNQQTELNANDFYGDLSVKVIADLLKINKSLKKINLSYNYIRDIGAQAIAEALKINKTLTYLNICYNDIGNLGIRAIADALKINNTLLYLDLSGNFIGDSGLSAIAEMLEINNSLRALNLRNNRFFNISKLEQALKYNKSLIKLLISEVPISTEVLERILEFNVCLLEVSKYPRESFQSTIQELLKRNEEIQTNLSKRIFKCKNLHLSLLDYQILERVNKTVIFENVWKLEQTQQIAKTYEECFKEYWELISLNSFSKYFLFILGVCKLNQIPPSTSHLLGIPKELLTHIGSFLNPKDFSKVINSKFIYKENKTRK